MPNRPRKHHYVPSFYLAGFTESGSDEDRLYVFDQCQIKKWPSTPRNAGYARDFYAVDLGPDVDPACFESGVLAGIECEFSRVVRESVEAERLPTGNDMDVMMNFVAFMAARTPRIRRLVGQVTDLVVKAKMRSLVATEEGWQDLRDCLRRTGIQNDDDEVEHLRQFILSGEYEVDLDRTSHVQKIVELVNAMLPLLAQRQWLLGIAAPGMPDFVCSDAPVSLAPTDRFESTDEPHLANHHTLLSMPLTRRVVLLGCYEERPPMFRVSEFGVLSTNSMTISEARYVFSAESDFVYLGSDRKPKRRDDLEESLRRRNGKYSNLHEAVDHWFQTRMASVQDTNAAPKAVTNDGGKL
jgi:hypothetical protein